MISEVIVSRLDELIGDYDTPFFNYLLYSYDLSLNDCENIIDELKSDIRTNQVVTDNVASTLEERFKDRVVEMEKNSKLDYLTELISSDNEFYIKYLKKHNLSSDEIGLIYGKVEDRILKDNITDFEIKRYLEYYFSNMVRQASYLSDLDWIVGRNYDTLIIKKAKKDNPILLDRDIVEVVLDIRSDILDAVDFKKGIKYEFKNRCMRKSEAKKARALANLEELVEGSGDSFSKLVKVKGMSRHDGEAIVDGIKEDIAAGRVQPDFVDNIFLTKRFNEYK